MFFEERRTVPDAPGALRAEYAVDLAAAVESVGAEAAVDRTGLDADTVDAVLAAADRGDGDGDGGADGASEADLPGLSLPEAAAIQALAEDAPDDPETIVEIACDHLLLGMSTAVLDVETLAGELSIDRTPKELQQKLERRAPMSFAEFVAIQHAIVERQQ